MTSRFIRLQCPLLLRPARRSPLDRGLHRWQSTRSPHILAIDGLYNGLIAINVSGPFVASIDILFRIFPIEEDTGNGMATWHFLQLQLFSSKSTVKLSSSFFTSNLVRPAQHAIHLLHANFSLYNLFLILGHNSDSTFRIICLFA